MEQRLAGKVAIVTGGTSGIGAATVRRLTKEGARVAFTGSKREAAERLCAETGAAFHPHRVEDADAWSTLTDQVLSDFGRLDIAFANAGTEAGDGDIEAVDLDAWNRILAINLTGVMLTAKHAIAAMRKNDGATGSIIVNSSMNAHWPLGNYVSYSVSKGALIALVKSVALHCAKEGYKIRCNSIHPGVVETEMITGIIDGAPDPAAARAQFEGMAPLRRMGSVDEVAALVAFLASDEAAFISGSEYSIDGATTAGMMGV